MPDGWVSSPCFWFYVCSFEKMIAAEKPILPEALPSTRTPKNDSFFASDE
jgi:hypothetical protein